jgi:hypothetical protein
MTYQDPNTRDPRMDPTDDRLQVDPTLPRRRMPGGWGIAIVAVLAVIVIVLFATTRNSNHVAHSGNPAATTTGSAGPAPAPNNTTAGAPKGSGPSTPSTTGAR